MPSLGFNLPGAHGWSLLITEVLTVFGLTQQGHADALMSCKAILHFFSLHLQLSPRSKGMHLGYRGISDGFFCFFIYIRHKPFIFLSCELIVYMLCMTRADLRAHKAQCRQRCFSDTMLKGGPCCYSQGICSLTQRQWGLCCC